MFARILDIRIPKSLVKPIKVQIYNETGDPNEHVEHVEDRLEYYHAKKDEKAKLFALTLT